MTVRERVLASRLIQKAESNESYAKQIGLSCKIVATEKSTFPEEVVPAEEKEG